MTADEAFEILHVEMGLEPGTLRTKIAEIGKLFRGGADERRQTLPENASATGRPAFRKEDLARLAENLDLDRGDVAILDCLLNKGCGLSDFHHYCSLMCGIFDSAAEQGKVLGRVVELASRCAARLETERASLQGRGGRELHPAATSASLPVKGTYDG